MSLEIRSVRPEEQGEAGELTARAYGEFAIPGDPDWDRYLLVVADVAGRAQRATVFVAVEDGRLLGTATLELRDRVQREETRLLGPLPPHEANVRMVAVHPDARRRGIARGLMEHCIDEARRHGKTILTLNTTERMTAAQRLYESMGFTRGDDVRVTSDLCLLSYRLQIA